jgi:hypothetical protein
VTVKPPGGLAQLARASALQAEGHRFDSDILHQKSSFKMRCDLKPSLNLLMTRSAGRLVRDQHIYESWQRDQLFDILGKKVVIPSNF